MTNDKTAKELAREMVGDGQSPNKYFVTHGPFYLEFDEYEPIDGFHTEQESVTYGPFDTVEEAYEKYDSIHLDLDDRVGQAFIEDRQTGMVAEKYLRRRLIERYEEDGWDESKIHRANARRVG